MIFSLADHIEQIKAGTKTQTRRPSNRYQVDRLYAIQPGRGKPGIPDGKILITAKAEEYKTEPPIWGRILKWQAEAEGGYTPEEYEELYESMYPGWEKRYAYLFEYFTTEELELMEKDPDKGFALYNSRKSQQEVKVHGGMFEDLDPELKAILSQQFGTRESKGERIK